MAGSGERYCDGNYARDTIWISLYTIFQRQFINTIDFHKEKRNYYPFVGVYEKIYSMVSVNLVAITAIFH